LHIFPEDALQTLASGCFGQGTRWMLAVKGTARRESQNRDSQNKDQSGLQYAHQRKRGRFDGYPLTHGVIVP
jgi:hypothetical protein